MSPTFTFPKYSKTIDGKNVSYELLEDPIIYHSERYDKIITVEVGFISDGASGPAPDLASRAWWIHDKLCKRQTWDDHTPCRAKDRSLVLHDALKEEGRTIRAKLWCAATYLWEKICLRD